MGLYDTNFDLNTLINEDLDKDPDFAKKTPVDSEDKKAIDTAKNTTAGKKLVKEMTDKGFTQEEVELFLLNEAKKAKKKAKKKKKDDDSDSDDDDKKSKKKDKDSDDDIDIDDIPDSDSESDKDEDSDSDDIDSESVEDKSSKSKKKKKKKDDDDTDEDDDDKKSKKKDKDKDSDDDSKDVKVESFFISSNYGKMKEPIELVREFFDSYYEKQYTKSKIPIPKRKGYLETARLRLPSGYVPPPKSEVYDKAVREFFDISDNNTRKILVSVDEEDQNLVLHSLTDKLYDVIVNKTETIDYGPIPETRGDFSAMPNYMKLCECVELLKQILKEYKQDTDPIDEIDTCINNLVDRKDDFKKCYMSNVQFGIVTYQTVAMACVASTSLMISGAIEFIKNPETNSYKIALDKVGYHKAKNNILFDNLKRFNMICSDKSFDRTLDGIIREAGKNFLGMSTMGGFAIAALVGVILFNILPILRECTYFFFYTKSRISDWFNLQADLLEISSQNLKSNNIETAGNKKDVIKKQEILRDRFRDMANLFAVDAKKAEVEADNAVRKEERKMKADEVMDDIPDSSKSALF